MLSEKPLSTPKTPSFISLDFSNSRAKSISFYSIFINIIIIIFVVFCFVVVFLSDSVSGTLITVDVFQ